jgi:transcriptional regulator with XRE-family HTH domain
MKELYRLRLIKLGAKIKEIRQAQNLTQLNLSDLAEVDIRTIQRLEKGDMNLSLNIFISVVKSLNVDATEIIQDITKE